MKISERERKALKALADSYDSYGDDGFCYLNFRMVATRSKLDPKVVRRTVRALARKGLAEYGKGLWTEDGEMFGSGYCCTKAGKAFIGVVTL